MTASPQTISKPTSQRIMVGVFFVLILIGIALIAADWKQMHQVLRQARWGWVLVALCSTTASYISLSYSFAIACRIFGIQMKWRELLEVSFISNVLNNLMTSGGAAGYSLRLLVMRHRGQTVADITAASLFHTYFNTFAILVLLPTGLTHLLTVRSVSTGGVIGIGAVVVLALVLLVLATAMMFSSAIRAAAFRRLSGLVHRLTRRDIGPSLAEFDSAVSHGVKAVRKKPAGLIWLIALVMSDWTASLFTLGFCFSALGKTLTLGELVTGFAIGVTAGLVSMVPGGIGVQDTSMAGIYALLGVPLEIAILAPVLFRIVYYLIPFGVSLVFYWGLVRRLKKEQQYAPENNH